MRIGRALYHQSAECAKNIFLQIERWANTCKLRESQCRNDLPCARSADALLFTLAALYILTYQAHQSFNLIRLETVFESRHTVAAVRYLFG